MELVDVPDSKSGGVHAPCRFDPDHRQIKIQTQVMCLFFVGGQGGEPLISVRARSEQRLKDTTRVVACNAVYCERLKNPDHRQIKKQTQVMCLFFCWWSRGRTAYFGSSEERAEAKRHDKGRGL